MFITVKEVTSHRELRGRRHVGNRTGSGLKIRNANIYKYLIFIIVLSHDASFSTAILEILKLNCVCTVPGNNVCGWNLGTIIETTATGCNVETIPLLNKGDRKCIYRWARPSRWCANTTTVASLFYTVGLVDIYAIQLHQGENNGLTT